MHVYLFSYQFSQGPGALGFGYQDISLPAPLQPKHVAQAVRLLAEKAGGPVVIVSIYKFEAPESLPADALPDANERARQRGLGG